MTTTITKTKKAFPKIVYPLKKDLNAWKGLCGIWKEKKIKGVLQWQRKIRKDWERKFNKGR